MDKNIKAIIENYDSVVKNNTGKPCVCIHGESGAGKTKLLQQLKDLLLQKGANAYFSIDKTGDSSIKEILRQLLRIYGEKYSPDFQNFIVSYIKGTLETDFSTDATSAFDKDSLVKFIYDCVKSEPTVFIIDDLDKADSFTINLLSNLLMFDSGFFLLISLSANVDRIILSDMLFRNANNIMYTKLSSPAQESHTNLSDTEDPDLVIDEVMLVLTKPGREKQLIKHYIKTAWMFMLQLYFEKAVDNYNEALKVCRNINDKDSEFIALMGLGDARAKCKEFADSIDNYFQASQVAAILNMPEKRALVFLSLANCYDILGKHDTAREYIMMSEAFFCFPNNRMEFYDIYSKHIIKYLYLLAELGEEVIFAEKLKQALDICRPDDEYFQSALYSERAYMFIHKGDYTKAHEILSLVCEKAKELKYSKMWDEVTNSLAICNEHLGKPKKSLELWNKIIKNSHDPVRLAGAMVNSAIMKYEQNGKPEIAMSEITTSVELCILAGENRIAYDICENLKNTPLASEATKHLSKYRL